MNYDPETATLKVHFVSGLVYEYKKVPPNVFEGMKSSTSKGAFLNQHIKGKYDFKKMN